MGKSLDLIEFVCTHNNGRSPLAEGFGRKYLESKGIKEYGVISSGTHVTEVDEMLERKRVFSNDISKLILQKGIEKGFFEDNSVIESILHYENFNDADAQNYAFQAANRFVSEEHGYKEQAFKKLGLGSPKVGRDQTMVIPESRLVLGMGMQNVKKINEIYTGESNLPIIETLTGYASGNPGQEFKSEFGGSLKDYLVMGEVIRDHVHGAIDRFLANQ